MSKWLQSQCCRFRPHVSLHSCVTYLTLRRFHPPDPYYRIAQVTIPTTANTTPTSTTTTHTITFSSEIKSITYPGLQIHFLPVGKHSILMLYFPSPQASATIIFSHGNATDCGAMFAYYARIAQTLQVNVVAYDYSGYGASGGTPSEQQTYDDITAVYNWTKTNTSMPILLYGQSVGSGPSCYLASLVPVAGLILHSPILSGVRVLTDSRLLACWDIYPNLKYTHVPFCKLFSSCSDISSASRLLYSYFMDRCVMK